MFEKEIQVLKALAKGVNYFTGDVCQNDSILNDPNIIRTLYDLCDELRDITLDKTKKAKFACPADIEEKFVYEEEMSLTQILTNISMLYPTMKKPKYKRIKEILIEKGLLANIVNEVGKKVTIATDEAKQYGIYNVKRVSIYGRSYQVVTYNKFGQRYILSLLKNG